MATSHFKATEVITMNNVALIAPDKDIAGAVNKIAAALNIVVPGLGLVYKGHPGAGFFWMFLGMPFAIWAGILLSLATGGVGLLLPLICWVALAIDGYYEKDIRRHHHLFPPPDEEWRGPESLPPE